MPRDTDGKKVTTKWGSTGDRSSPESQNMTRAAGWTAAFAPGGGLYPFRRVFNQLWAEITGMLAEINQRGILEWDADLEYVEHARVMGSDGNLYRAVVATGPGSSNAVDPVGRSDDLVWKADQTASPPNATTTTRGLNILATNAESINGTDNNKSVTPAGSRAHGDDRYARGGATGAATKTARGILELATKTENIEGMDDERATTSATNRAAGDERYLRGTVPTWSNTTDYGVGAIARGSNNTLYVAVVANGPNEGNIQNPFTRTNDNIWRVWALGSIDDLNVPSHSHGSGDIPASAFTDNNDYVTGISSSGSTVNAGQDNAIRVTLTLSRSGSLSSLTTSFNA